MNAGLEAITAVALGVVAGFVTSIPGGPINATIVAETPRRGLRWALFLGLGAVWMEAIYCTCAFAGFAQFLMKGWALAAIELASFILMLWLGLKYLRGGTVPGERRMEALVEETFHPSSAFWTGFLRVLGNPGVLLLWVTIVATLLSRGWLDNDWSSKWPFVGGVAAGAFAWFALVGWGVSRGRHQFEERTLRRFSMASGIFLLLVALVVGTRLVQLLAERHGGR